MRTFFLFCCLLAGLSTVHAQVERGDDLLLLTGIAPFRAPTPIPALANTAGLYRNPSLEETNLYFSAGYGKAIIAPLVIGGRVQGTASFGEYGRHAISLLPFARYYVINTPALLVFGEVASGLEAEPDDTRLFESAELSAGVQLPVGGGAYLSPTLSYQIHEGSNSLALGASLQLLLGDQGEEEAPSRTFRRGELMLGLEGASVNLFESGNSINANLGAHYFLTGRLAVGGLIGYGRSYNYYEIGGSTPDRYVRFSRLHLGAGARYYLTGGDRLVWFAEAGLGRFWESMDTNTGIDYFDGSFTYLTGGVGGQYFVTRRLALEAGPQLRYNLTSEQLIPGLNFGLRFLL